MILTDVALLVIAKQPIPGRVKTRLCPPCTPEQAAALAAAALTDTLTAVADAPARRRVLVFDGDPSDWTPPGFDVVHQRGDGLGERLAAAFTDVPGPALLVGMDTPQISADRLIEAMSLLVAPDVDAVLAPTDDGGYWCVGFSSPAPGAFDGVPMSTEQTHERQLARLVELGRRVALAPPMRDVDDIAAAHAAAAEAPESAFAAALAPVLAAHGSVAA